MLSGCFESVFVLVGLPTGTEAVLLSGCLFIVGVAVFASGSLVSVLAVEISGFLLTGLVLVNATSFFSVWLDWVFIVVVAVLVSGSLVSVLATAASGFLSTGFESGC